jgi:hypothetical protein
MVQLIRLDLQRRQIDLGLSEILEAVRRSARPNTRRSKVEDRKEQGRRSKGRGRPRKRERAFKNATRRKRR